MTAAWTGNGGAWRTEGGKVGGKGLNSEVYLRGKEGTTGMMFLTRVENERSGREECGIHLV